MGHTEVQGLGAPFPGFLPFALYLLTFETYVSTMSTPTMPVGWGKIPKVHVPVSAQHHEFTQVLCSGREGFPLCLPRECLILFYSLTPMPPFPLSPSPPMLGDTHLLPDLFSYCTPVDILHQWVSDSEGRLCSNRIALSLTFLMTLGEFPWSKHQV